MPRTSIYRLRATATLVAFAATGGLTGMEAHPLSQHGLHTDDFIALELSAESHAAAPSQTARGAAGQASRHSGRPQHGQSNDCTCVGMCQGGASPSVSISSSTTVALADTEIVRAITAQTVVVPFDPRSYFLPLPNPPPRSV